MKTQTVELTCDICNKKFSSKYDYDTETSDDAAFMHSCFKCGLVLCHSCEIKHYKEGHEKEESYED